MGKGGVGARSTIAEVGEEGVDAIGDGFEARLPGGSGSIVRIKVDLEVKLGEQTTAAHFGRELGLFARLNVLGEEGVRKLGPGALGELAVHAEGELVNGLVLVGNLAALAFGVSLLCLSMRLGMRVFVDSDFDDADELASGRVDGPEQVGHTVGAVLVVAVLSKADGLDGLGRLGNHWQKGVAHAMLQPLLGVGLARGADARAARADLALRAKAFDGADAAESPRGEQLVGREALLASILFKPVNAKAATATIRTVSVLLATLTDV